MSEKREEFLKDLKTNKRNNEEDRNYADFVFASLNSKGPHDKTQKQLEDEAADRNLANKLAKSTDSER